MGQEERLYCGQYFEENGRRIFQRSVMARNASDAFHRMIQQLRIENPDVRFDIDRAHVWRAKGEHAPDDFSVAGYVRPFHGHADGSRHAHPNGHKPHCHTEVTR